MIEVSMLDTSALTALRFTAWANVGVAAALLVGAVAWFVWCEIESRDRRM
jgi:hypothetical protein